MQVRVGKPVGTTVVALLAVAGAGAIVPAHATVDLPPDYQVLQPVSGNTTVDRPRLQQRIEKAWSAAALGDTKALAVDAFASPPRPEVDLAGDEALMPASTTKLLTAAGVLKALGPETRFTTAVTRQGKRLFLVGGGDPQLSSVPTPQRVNADASLARLARQTAAVLAADGVSRVSLQYDDTLFAPPTEQAYWRKDFLAIGVVAPITALMVDGGRLASPASPRSPDPSLTATQKFAELLTQRGISVQGPLSASPAAGKQIAAVESPPLADLVEHMLLVSDNTEAEVLAHQTGLEVLGEATFAGGALATLETLTQLGVDTQGVILNDGSGLSRANRISPQVLLAVLRAAMETDPDALWPVYTGLPVAGFDGSLAARFSAAAARPARGTATGKTGTLTGTSTLAGLVVDRDGQLLTYAMMTNDISVWTASPAIDQVVGRIAGCRCAAAE